MVYKKYIKRDGKVFGPYYYESYREKGRVKTRFVSGPKKGDIVGDKLKSMRNYFIFGFLILVIIGIFVLAFYYSDKISERIYSTGLLSPPYGDGERETETPREPSTPEEKIRTIAESYSFEEITEDLIREKFFEEDIEKDIRLKRISDNVLEIYDADTGDLVVTITRGVNKVDINFH